jgi:hypothetical protein
MHEEISCSKLLQKFEGFGDLLVASLGARMFSNGS